MCGIIIICAYITANAQNDFYPFLPTERINYGVYYHWGVLWLNAGEVVFSSRLVDDASGKQKQWYLKAYGYTYRMYDNFYSVRDTFETRLTYPDFKPLWFRRVIHHDTWYSMHDYRFNMDSMVVNSSIISGKGGAVVRQRITIPFDVHDLLSAAYYFRGYDYNALRPGERINFKLLIDTTAEPLSFTYLGKEVVTTRTNRTFRCHKISVQLVAGDFFQGGKEMSVWFTDDYNRLPVMVSTDIVVGAVHAILTDIANLKYPLSAEQ